MAQGQIDELDAYYGFEEMEIIKLEWGQRVIRIADFNRDMRNDIAILNNRKAKVEIYLQQEEIGPGEEQIAVDENDIDINAINPDSRFKKEEVAVSLKMASFVTGDLNSDGLVDMAFYGEPKGLYVLLQKEGEADSEASSLSWRPKKKIAIDDGLMSVNALARADLNNDGRDDLALASNDSIYLILQEDDGSLAEPVKYPTHGATLSVEVGDLNGDGINDLVLITNDAEEPIHVRFGLEGGELGPETRLYIEKPWAFEMADIDGEKGDEILSLDAVSGRLICYKYAEQTDADAEWPILFYPLISGESSSKRDLAIGDFDGDGQSDIMISDPASAEVLLYKQVKGVGLAEPVRFPALSEASQISAQDIDGDTKADLVMLSVKEKIIGISSYVDDRMSFPKPLRVVGEPVGMAIADLDGYVGADCAYISRDANDKRSLRVIYDLASNTEDNEPNAVLELEKLYSNPQGMRAVDVDQDGLRDLLIFVDYEAPILILQTSRGIFEIVDSPSAQASLIKDASSRSIAVADINGQGGDELLIAQKNFARSLYFADGKTWTIVDQYNAQSIENSISSVAVFPLDSQVAVGRPEILLLDGQKGHLQILKAGSDNTYRFDKRLDVGKWSSSGHLKMLFAPLSGNERESILLFDGGKFALITPPAKERPPYYLEQQFSYETKIKDGAYGNFTTGEINSDDRIDIIMVEYKRNHIEILTLNAEEKAVPGLRFKVFEQKSYRDKSQSKASIEPKELKVSDVTGDGKDDLVTLIHDRIIIYPQD
jgi:hypothetical protein